MTKQRTAETDVPAKPGQEPADLLAEALPQMTRTNEAEASLASRVLERRRAKVRPPTLAVKKHDGRGPMESTLEGGTLGALRLCHASGTDSVDFADWSLSQLTDAVVTTCDNAAEAQKEMNAALAVLNAMEPRDPLEAMLISQMVACHRQAMRGAGRMRGAQSIDQQRANERAANAFMRTFTAQLEALKRYRSKGEQTVRVERVYVAEGGQAIVGDVHTSGGPGGSPKISDQSHAKGGDGGQ